MKTSFATLILTIGFIVASQTMAYDRDNAISVGAIQDGPEKINLSLLNALVEEERIINRNPLLNSKVESIRDTKRKSFRSYNQVEELSDSDMLVIQ